MTVVFGQGLERDAAPSDAVAELLAIVVRVARGDKLKLGVVEFALRRMPGIAEIVIPAVIGEAETGTDTREPARFRQRDAEALWLHRLVGNAQQRKEHAEALCERAVEIIQQG